MCGPIIREMRDWSDDVSKGSVRFFFAPVFKRQNRDRFFGNCRCLLHCPPWALQPAFQLRTDTARQFLRLLDSVPSLELCDVHDFRYDIA